MVIPPDHEVQAMTPDYLKLQPGLSVNQFLPDHGTQPLWEPALKKACWQAGCYSAQHALAAATHCLAWQGQGLPMLGPSPGSRQEKWLRIAEAWC